MKRVLVSIPKGSWEVIEKLLKGKMGDKDSEVVRNIVLAYLSEKGYMRDEIKKDAPAIATQQAKQEVQAAEKKEEVKVAA